MTSITGKVVTNQSGFTYIMALLAVALVTIASSIAYTSTRHVALKVQEQELLFRGMAYYQAIESYYLALTPHQYPAHLQDLLKDPRFLHRRHLRKLYPPANGETWSLVKNKRGRIMGVYYNSARPAIKRAGFEPLLESFSKAETYADWRFVYPLLLPEKKKTL